MNRALRCTIAGLILSLALGISACSSDSDDTDAGAGNPASNLTAAQAKAPLKDAPSELVSLRKNANKVIDDGDQFQQQLDSLKAAGIPVVVNKWASWCGPCREEFPDFQDAAKKYGNKVAFIGLNSKDGVDTAETFLSEFPVPYPSYEDPDESVARTIGADYGFPNTIFIDGSGDPVYKQLGPFTDPGDLEADIEKYLQ